MAGRGATPREAATALVKAMPKRIAESTLEEYGIESTSGRAQALTREIFFLNLFWVFAAIEAHIPKQFHAAVSELVLEEVEAEWGTTYSVGSIAWASFLDEWKERTHRYEGLIREGMSPLGVCAEVGLLLEEQHVVGEEDRRNVLTLLIDSVPVETYGQLLREMT
ncbi:hypothetical protein [Petrachloros mirabilis]